jgi:hypothetical protein
MTPLSSIPERLRYRISEPATVNARPFGGQPAGCAMKSQRRLLPLSRVRKTQDCGESANRFFDAVGPFA